MFEELKGLKSKNPTKDRKKNIFRKFKAIRILKTYKRLNKYSV